MTGRSLSVADIFCGTGGLSTGFVGASASWDCTQRLGYKVVFATDNNKQAMQTFRRNHFPDVPLDQTDPRAYCGDVSLVDASRVRDAARPLETVDVLIGGPSCQGVSPAGLRNPTDKRNHMLLAFVRLVQELRPLWFVMENVPGLTHANNLPLLAGILRLFEAIDGYQVACDVLLAADFGVPQFRYRLFVIGTRTGMPIRFPVPSRVCSPTEEDVASYATVRDAIADLTTVEPVEYDQGESPTRKATGGTNHWCRKLGETNRRRIAAVRPGHDWRDIPVALLPERYFLTRSSDQKGTYGRLSWDWPAYTITNASLNVSAGAFSHPDHNRCLSVREVARLQSFDDDYEFLGSVDAQYQQVGNAVPPKLAKAVAEAVLLSHFNAGSARTWGRAGRLTLELIEKCLRGEAQLPTLTPRRVHPATARSSRQKTPRRQNATTARAQVPTVWQLEPRPKDKWPEDTRRLRKLAEQPQYIRAAKRAKSIVQFLEGMPRAEIVEHSNVSEASLQKWIDGYFAGGLNGWRAFHSSFDHLGGDDPQLQVSIADRIARVRKVLLAPRREGRNGDARHRLHMNGYLTTLIDRFGASSVDALIAEVERSLGVALGTVYVGDLLAIADIVLVHRHPGDSLRGNRQAVD